MPYAYKCTSFAAITVCSSSYDYGSSAESAIPIEIIEIDRATSYDSAVLLVVLAAIKHDLLLHLVRRSSRTVPVIESSTAVILSAELCYFDYYYNYYYS